MLLALDPGLNSPGAALFLQDVPEPRLWAAAQIEIPDSLATLGEGRRWWAVAQEIVSWAVAAAAPACVTAVVFERPQWYARGKSKGDPNQLAGVAGVAANVTGTLGTHRAITISSPAPAEWIGQLSKVCPTCKGKAKKKCKSCHGSAWETPRGRFIRKRLTANELELVPDQNDAIDAVGLGLWQLGRLVPHVALSNGRDGR